MRLENAVIGRRVEAVFRAPRLNVVMSGLFVCLSIPILIFILVYNYRANSRTIIATLHEEVAKNNRTSIENAENLIRSVASTLRLLAAATAKCRSDQRRHE
jgi:hypothetical protein